MKKILLMLSIMLLLFGCQKEPEVVYDYDFLNYIDIELIGPNGYATVYTSIKDFDASNAKNDEDYIVLKKLMPELLENIYVSNYSGLKNGDQITIGVSETYVYSGPLSINLSPRTLTVQGLKEPESLDLFSSDNVVFYGIEGTNKVEYYIPSGSKIPADIQNELVYTLNIDDSTVAANKTIVNGSVEISSDELEKDVRYETTAEYFVAKGLIPKLSSEFTLKKVTGSDKVLLLDADEVKNELEDAIQNYLGEEVLLKRVYKVFDLNKESRFGVLTEIYPEKENPDYIRTKQFDVQISSVDNRILIKNIKDTIIQDNASHKVAFDYPELVIEEEPVETPIPEITEITE